MQSQLFDVRITVNTPSYAQAGAVELLTPKKEMVMEQILSIQDTQRLENRRQIVLMIQDTPLPLPLMQNCTIILGRIDLHSKLRPDIDLTPYGAAEHGVSRTHCSLLYRNYTLFLTDLGSSNGTYLNERRLRPNRAEEVIIGDIVTLGELAIELALPHGERYW